MRTLFNNALVAVLVLAVALTGCSLLGSLQLIVDATAAAVPILEAAGINVPPDVIVYVGDVANCIGSQGGNPNAEQLALIAACLAEKVAPTLPPGTASAVVDIIAAIVRDVANYIAHPPVGLSQGSNVILSPKDALEMRQLRAKAQDTAAKCKALAARKR